MKATICKFCEMSWPALTQLKAWIRRSTSFNTFDVNELTTPSLRVASATDDKGETLVYVPVENVLMVSAYAVNSNATPIEAQQAGDAVDSLIERHAQQAGISKLLLVARVDQPGLPEGDWKTVKILERRIPHIPLMGIGSYNSKPTEIYVN